MNTNQTNQAMSNNEFQIISDQISRIAINAALAYLNAQNLKIASDCDIKILSVELKTSTKKHLETGMSDAKAALDCGMDQIAIETLKASMALAGIEAAKNAVMKTKEGKN